MLWFKNSLYKYHFFSLHLLICDALCDLVPFVQFKNREKHPWRSVNFSEFADLKPATLLKLTLFHECFSRFLNCANGIKPLNAPHISSSLSLTPPSNRIFSINSIYVNFFT